jgi:REP element-mobilizing transposase RayT
MMHHRLHIHLVWTTRDRVASLDRGRALYLSEHLPIIARQGRARVLALGVVSTHVHVLMRLHPTTDIPQLLQRMKGGTAHGVNAANPSARPSLRWAKGYSITSVSPGGLARVRAYVNTQHLHHPTEAIAGWDPEHVGVAMAMDTSSSSRARR